MNPKRLYRSNIIRAAFLLCLIAITCPGIFSETRSASPADPSLEFDRLFQRNDGGWTGGDGTLSVPLPDGRTVWFFGDSFLGRVSDGQHPPDAPLIHNCLVVQHGKELATLFRNEHGSPSAFFQPPAGPASGSSREQWYWPGHGIVEDDRLKIFLFRFERTGPNLWEWKWLGADIATLALPSLSITHIAPAPATGVMYGVCVLQSEKDIYIYGASDSPGPKKAYLARARNRGVQGPWQYYDGENWSDDPGNARPILSGVSAQYAVVSSSGEFCLFTMDERTPFSSDLVVYRAPHPWGPWRGPLKVYRAPEAIGGIVAYNPFVHPQFSKDGRVLVSYNLNAVSDPWAVYRNAAIYRPRFIWVDLTALESAWPPKNKK